jgi:hypothetical protein
MGLFDTVRSWFSTEPSASDVDQKLRRTLRSSMEIVSAYGAILERGGGSSVPTIKLPEADLPYSKQGISQAIAILQQAIRHPHLRTILVQSLSPAEAQHVLSSQFERGLETGLVLLETFVPTAEVEAERKQWEDALKLVEKIDPAARARIENTLAGAQRVSPKKEAT